MVNLISLVQQELRQVPALLRANPQQMHPHSVFLGLLDSNEHVCVAGNENVVGDRFPRPNISEGNCSVKPWSGPPACSPSMAAEQPTKYPSSTPIRTGAGSGDATHGVGPIRSLRLRRDRTSRLAITLGWPVVGWSRLPVSWLKGETDSTGLDRCAEHAHRPLFHGLTEQLLADQILIGTVGPDRMATTDPSDHSSFPTGGGTCGP